jgi:hypothetical protein
MHDFLVTFISTHHALKAEADIKKVSAGIILIPTPREISSECGFSLLVKDGKMDIVKLKKFILYEHVYIIRQTETGEKEYEKIA